MPTFFEIFFKEVLGGFLAGSVNRTIARLALFFIEQSLIEAFPQ